jgi:hypothetical protein
MHVPCLPLSIYRSCNTDSCQPFNTTRSCLQETSRYHASDPTAIKVAAWQIQTGTYWCRFDALYGFRLQILSNNSSVNPFGCCSNSPVPFWKAACATPVPAPPQSAPHQELSDRPTSPLQPPHADPVQHQHVARRSRAAPARCTSQFVSELNVVRLCTRHHQTPRKPEEEAG